MAEHVMYVARGHDYAAAAAECWGFADLCTI